MRVLVRSILTSQTLNMKFCCFDPESRVVALLIAIHEQSDEFRATLLKRISLGLQRLRAGGDFRLRRQRGTSLRKGIHELVADGTDGSPAAIQLLDLVE
jgi:hypothetical protein